MTPLIVLSLLGLVGAEIMRDPCVEICHKTEGCKADIHGSYCKVDKKPAVCFGLLEIRKNKKYCFEPFDPVGCRDKYFSPVDCSEYAESLIPIDNRVTP